MLMLRLRFFVCAIFRTQELKTFIFGTIFRHMLVN